MIAPVVSEQSAQSASRTSARDVDAQEPVTGNVLALCAPGKCSPHAVETKTDSYQIEKVMFGSNPSAFHSTSRAPPLFVEKSRLNLGILPPPPYNVAVSSLDNSVNYLRRNVVELKIASSPELPVVTSSFGLSNDTGSDVKIEDADGELEPVDDDQPLDLSMKRPQSSQATESVFTTSASTSGVPLIRPTVIRNSAYGRSFTPREEKTRKHVEMKRSASSVATRTSPDAAVSEHFRRSLSGKWPRRQSSKYSAASLSVRPHLMAPSPSTVLDSNLKASSPVLSIPSARTPPSRSSLGTSPLSPGESSSSSTGVTRSNSGRSSCTMTQIIVNNGEIDDHFRKALGEENFKLWRNRKGRDD